MWFAYEDGAVWLVEYQPGHAWAILWGFSQEVVRAWPELAIGVPCHAEAAGLDAARTGARRIARLIAERRPACLW